MKFFNFGRWSFLTFAVTMLALMCMLYTPNYASARGFGGGGFHGGGHGGFHGGGRGYGGRGFGGRGVGLALGGLALGGALAYGGWNYYNRGYGYECDPRFYDCGYRYGYGY